MITFQQCLQSRCARYVYNFSLYHIESIMTVASFFLLFNSFLRDQHFVTLFTHDDLPFRLPEGNIYNWKRENFAFKDNFIRKKDNTCVQKNEYVRTRRIDVPSVLNSHNRTCNHVYHIYEEISLRDIGKKGVAAGLTRRKDARTNGTIRFSLRLIQQVVFERSRQRQQFHRVPLRVLQYCVPARALQSRYCWNADTDKEREKDGFSVVAPGWCFTSTLTPVQLNYPNLFRGAVDIHHCAQRTSFIGDVLSTHALIFPINYEVHLCFVRACLWHVHDANATTGISRQDILGRAKRVWSQDAVGNDPAWCLDIDTICDQFLLSGWYSFILNNK